MCASPRAASRRRRRRARAQRRRRRGGCSSLRVAACGLRKRRVDVLGGLHELRVRLGDLLLVADVAEGVEQVGGRAPVWRSPARRPCAAPASARSCARRARARDPWPGTPARRSPRTMPLSMNARIWSVRVVQLREHLGHGVGNRQRHQRRIDARTRRRRARASAASRPAARWSPAPRSSASDAASACGSFE